MTYGPNHSQHCGCAPRLNEALDLIADLADRSPCVYDHHGHCQTHMSGPGEECPHEVARRVLLRRELESSVVRQLAEAPVPGACDIPGCPVLHEDPKNPIHPPAEEA